MLHRRQFLCTAALGAARARESLRPNFVVIVTDDHGYHDLGCQGARDLQTPHLDALAASGARLTHWYSNAPMCAPSRASLLTGRYPARAGVPTNGPALPPGELTIPALLKPHGYATGLTGKWHLGSGPDTAPNARGFDFFFGFHSGCIDFYSHRYYWGEPRRVNHHDLWRNRAEVFEDGRYMTELITAEALRFIESRRSRPFFLYVAYNAPHYPMHAPRRYTERFPDLEPERRMYAAMLAAVDDGVGQIVSLLKKLGLTRRTMIFFQGDNGATREARAGLNQQPARGGSNAPLRGYKFSLFEGGIRVPALVNWPGTIPSGQVIAQPGAAMDLLPAILGAAGAPLPAGRVIDGRDVLPMFRHRTGSPHEAIFWSSGRQLAVRRGRWKLVLNGIVSDGTPEGSKPLAGEDSVFLSDLENDPAEAANLRRTEPGTAEELERLARGWLAGLQSGTEA
ncbi:MAG: sulfatase-like hydrolase/transferase [Bryobacterales bacterium]|nr:sulfatase-like hydrolase/transferase [Bryobacterales bacterium]